MSNSELTILRRCLNGLEELEEIGEPVGPIRAGVSTVLARLERSDTEARARRRLARLIARDAIKRAVEMRYAQVE